MPETVYQVQTSDGLPLLQCWTKQIPPGAHVQQMQCYASLRVVRIRKGQARWQIGTSEFSVMPGDLLLFNNREPRRILEILPGDPLCLETTAFLPFAVYPNQAALTVFFGRQRLRRLPAEGACAIYPVLDALWQEAAHTQIYHGEMLQALLTQLTVLLARSCPHDLPDPCDTDEYHRVMQTVWYLHRHITEPLLEETLARHAGMSISAFSRAFRRCNGITLAAYLRRCRVLLALNRLRTENGNVLEIALQCGFSSSSGFYKAVHEVTGGPPRQGLGAGACNPVKEQI